VTVPCPVNLTVFVTCQLITFAPISAKIISVQVINYFLLHGAATICLLSKGIEGKSVAPTGKFFVEAMCPN
jgi:hypothetical protein